MRLYRGKRKDNGEWVYGWLVESTSNNKSYIVTSATGYKEDCTEIEHLKAHGQLFIHGYYQVIPSTVGQATGLCDKNGKETYLGQRLEDKDGNEYQIVWIDRMAAFWIIQLAYPYEKYTAEVINKFEIIGKIYEGENGN